MQSQKDFKYFLNNHLRLNILFNKDANTDLSRVVGFEVEAFSVKHGYEAPWDDKNPVLNTCNPSRNMAVSHTQIPQVVEEGEEVIFTYDVKFTVSTVTKGGLSAAVGTVIFTRPKGGVPTAKQ